MLNIDLCTDRSAFTRTAYNPSRGLEDLLLLRRARTELDRSQWLSRRDVELIQMRRLRALLMHAYESVPYYHRIFEDAKVKPEDIHSLQDLTKLPVLKKEDVRHHTSEMISSKYGLKDMQQMSTSGSTSIPLRVYRTKEQRAYAIASVSRYHKWLNIGQYDLAVQIAPGRINQIGLNLIDDLRLDSYEVTMRKLQWLVTNIRRLRPKFLVGFPSGQNLFTRFCEEQGVDDIAFESIECCGEKVFEDEKSRMKRVFGSQVYEYYLAIESDSIGYDCSEHSGLHICSENVLVEFLKDGEPASEGEMASVVVTPLFSYGMPLMRYELGDAARRLDDICPCGRGLPLMSYIDGRMTDILVTPDGRLLCNSNFYSRIFDHIDVQQYRIIQEKVDRVVVELVPGRDYSQKAEEFIVSSVKKYMGQEVEVSVKLKDEIEPGTSQKRKVVVSYVPVKL